MRLIIVAKADEMLEECQVLPELLVTDVALDAFNIAGAKVLKAWWMRVLKMH